MNDGAAGDAERATRSESVGARGIRRLHQQIRLALGFLTILPVLPSQILDDESVAGSLGWFPLIGFALGGILIIEDLLLRAFFGAQLRSTILILSLAIVTGAVHLDGLADTADALGAGSDRSRALEILRDSRIGSFGAIALFFTLALKIIALSTIGGSARYLALCFAPGIARWAMVAVSYRMDYLRAQGAGSVILADTRGRSLAIASATVALAVVVAHSLDALVAWAIAAFAVLLLQRFYDRWLGGVTGDLIGAAGELVEVLMLVAMSV